MVELLQDSAETSGDPDSVRISVVPFGQTVRLRAGDYRIGTNVAGWLVNSTTHATSNQLFRYRNATNNTVNQAVNRFQLFDRLGIAWGGCVESRPAPFDVQDTGHSPSQPNSYFIPYFAPDEPDATDGNTIGNSNYYYGNTRYELSTYNNYVNDKAQTSWPTRSYRIGENRFEIAQANTEKYTNPNFHNNRGSRGPNRGCELSPLLPLTTDFDDVRATIGNLQAAGNTNIPLGLVWGWHTLFAECAVLRRVRLQRPERYEGRRADDRR